MSVPMSVMFDRVTFLCIPSHFLRLTLFMCVYSFILYFTSAPFIHSPFHLFPLVCLSVCLSIVSIPLLRWYSFVAVISFIQNSLFGQESDLMWRRKGTSDHERWSFHFLPLSFPSYVSKLFI